MSVFNNGLMRTIKAHYIIEYSTVHRHVVVVVLVLFFNVHYFVYSLLNQNSEGDLRVIRPFVYIREKVFQDFAERNKLPVITENCPACFAIPKERRRIKNLLAAQEHLNPSLFGCLLRAMKPLMKTNMKYLLMLAEEHERMKGQQLQQQGEEEEDSNENDTRAKEGKEVKKGKEKEKEREKEKEEREGSGSGSGNNNRPSTTRRNPQQKKRKQRQGGIMKETEDEGELW